MLENVMIRGSSAGFAGAIEILGEASEGAVAPCGRASQIAPSD
jgi:hypothetical protein